MNEQQLSSISKQVLSLDEQAVLTEIEQALDQGIKPADIISQGQAVVPVSGIVEIAVSQRVRKISLAKSRESRPGHDE